MKTDSIISLPKLGESILSATVVQWFKKVGDRVEKDEALLEVSTDKVNSEIPSPTAGILTEILAGVGTEIQVGEPLAAIGGSLQAQSFVQEAPVLEKTVATEATNSSFLSPAVLRLLQEKGIELHKINQIPRTGEGGRLTKQDVEKFACGVCPKEQTSSLVTQERIKMTPLRKAIAENMVKSFYEAPHASLVMEVDVTALVKKISYEKEPFFKEHGIKLTITPFIAKAIAQAIKKFPHINSSLEEDTIVIKKSVNLGIAVSIDQGVMVPVICDTEKLTIAQIGKKIAELAEKARGKTLQPNDVQGGTITLTNFGMAGAFIGTPIIRFPEVAIVGVGTISRKVMPMADDSIAIRSIVMISLTFDHRVLDGIYGCEFLKEVKALLESAFTP